MLPTKRAVALAMLLALAFPGALAQAAPVEVRLTPDHVEATVSTNATTSVRVTNGALYPVTVTLRASNVTGGLELRFATTELNVLPGGSATTELVIRGPRLGAWGATIHADAANAVGATHNATADLRVTVRGSNTTEPPPGNVTAPPEPSAPAPPTPSPEEPAAAAPPPPPPPPPAPTLETTDLVLDARRGEPTAFRALVRNPADVAQRVDLTLSLPLGWGGSLDAATLEIAPGATVEARGLVRPGLQARDDEATLRASGPGGSATLRLLLRVAAESAPTGARGGEEPVRPSAEALPSSAPPPEEVPPAAPREPTLRVEPEEIGGRAGASLVFTLRVSNPGVTPLTGSARADIAPLEVAIDAPRFVAGPEDEAIVVFVVTVPDGLAAGTVYEGVAATSLGGGTAPFRVRIEGAAPPPPAPVEAAAAPGWLAVGGVLLGAAGLGAALWRRWPAFGLVALYARLAPQRALEHPRRAAMLATLHAEPGLTLADLRRRLGVSNGVARHHLALLVAAGVVRVVPDGALRRLWPIGGSARPVPPLRERALVTLRESGAMRASELAEALGVSRQALHYHVKRLVQDGHVEATREDAEVLLRSRS